MDAVPVRGRCSPNSTMIRSIFISIISIYSWAIIAAKGDVILSDARPPTVKTEKAIYSGLRIEVTPKHVPGFRRNVAVYSRIPYAEPPVGELRFARPVPKIVTGQFEANREPIACSQVPTPFMVIDLPMSEDCLYLDVTVPEPQPKAAAVMVSIHGGGYHIGTGKNELADTGRLAAIGDVIVVTFNYRLGMLGFQTTGDNEIPSNVGLLDQRLVLLWVQENIAAFGGDPRRVTIGGVSAGSASVNLHLLSTMSAGLFSGAIMQSGALTTWTHFSTIEQGIQMTYEFGRELGCDAKTSSALVQCLRTKPVEEMAAVQSNVTLAIARHMFLPVPDGSFLLRDPTALAEEGSFNPARVMAGCLAEEGNMGVAAHLFDQEGLGKAVVDEAAFRERMAGLFVGDSAVQDTLAVVFGSEETFRGQSVNYVDAISGFFGDSAFVCPTYTMVRQLSRAGRTVFSYLMTHQPSHSVWGKNTTGMGATHGEDIAYVSGNVVDDETDDVDYYFRGRFTEEEGAMSLQVMRYWTNFAKTGDPNLPTPGEEDRFPPIKEQPVWPKFLTLEPAYKELSLTFDTREGTPHAKQCHFLSELFPKLMANAAELSHLKTLLKEKVNADSEKTCKEPNSCP